MKKIMKRATIGTVLTALVLTVSACSGSTNDNMDNSGTENGSAVSDDTLTVTIWDNGQKAGLDQIIADYTEATGQKAQIQVVNWDQYWALLEAGATGGELPDVFWMHSNEAYRYMSNGILMDLSDKVSESEKLNMDQFPEDIRNLYQYEGKTYAIPKDVDTIALWYNKTMFDEAGISYPDESWTWDDYYEAAVKLTKEDGSQFGTAMNPTNNQDGWMNIVYSMGGTVINENKTHSGFDDPNTIKAMEYLDKLIKNAMPSAASMSETGNDVLFYSGKIAMLPFGSWMVSPLKENEYVAANCDVAVLPKDAQSGRRVSIYNGLGWAVSSNTKNPEAAWQLVEWFGSKEAQEKQAELGVSMAAYEGVSEGWKNNTELFDLQPYLDMREDVVFRPYSKTTVAWENQISEDLRDAWNGNVSMADACAKITMDMDEILAGENQEEPLHVRE